MRTGILMAEEDSQRQRDELLAGLEARFPPTLTTCRRSQLRRSWQSSARSCLARGYSEVWNSSAGVASFTELNPVKKFTTRKAPVARLWCAVQRLSPDS